MRIGCLFFILGFFCSLPGFTQVKNEDEVKKQAEKYFDDEEYNLAYKLYSQLVSNYPKDPELNYRLGVCMLYTESDKKKPYSYLKFAASSKDAPKDAKFYLAKTYHINYQFDEALKLYSEYKQIGSSSSIKKLQVDREIAACKSGKRLLTNLSDLVVISKKQLNESDYFRSYDLNDIGGKLLVKPDEFKTSKDKKKKEKSVIYLPKNGQRIYFSSYGESEDKGRDIFFVNKLPNGSWSVPQVMPATINTEFDEDYPFLHPNGTTLYFSSKGHNSMGGYDIFKTTFDDGTQTWSNPINLDFPINSPDDDILFVTDSLEKTAYFSTGRYSPVGKIDVLKINTERRPMNFAVLKGTVLKEEVTQSLKSKITVKNIENGETVGTYVAQENGDYNMEIPNGGKFIFTVETPGLTTQSEGVTIPVAYSLKPYKQVISYNNKTLKITNYFDGQIADENYSMMLALIEKKAKLEMNESEPINNGVKEPLKNQNNGSENANLNAINTTHPTITNSENNSNTNKNITNEQLLEMAKTDAKEASDEAVQLKKEAEDAFGLATQKTAEAIALQKEADAVLTNANSITEVTKKNEELSKAKSLKDDANTATNVANIATNLAKKLEVDANLQQQESDLTNQYIKEIEAVTKNKNNKEALVKLEKIQKELSVISTTKNQSDELFSSLKAESELKQKELHKSETKSNTMSSDISIIDTEVKGLEKDLANESDNGIKDNIKAQIKELNNEIELKNKELETNNQKINTLKNEVATVNKEIEISAKIMNEKTDVIASNNDNINKTEGAVEMNANTNTINNSNYENITEKYKNETTSTANTKEDITKQNDVINNYNKEVGELLAKDKNELAKTNDANEKKNLNDEIKKLENIKSSNDNILQANNEKTNQLENAALTSNSTNTVSTSEITPNVVSNEVTTNATVPNNTEASVSANTLLNEAETLSNKATLLRKEATTKTGTEKETLLKQASGDEKTATTKKIQASEINQKQNKETFDNTNVEVTELKKLTGTKINTEILQATKLLDEATISFNQAQKIRDEANANTNNAAKLGGLSNAEEKENEALLKQQKGLEILAKENPDYKSKTTDVAVTNNTANTTTVVSTNTITNENTTATTETVSATNTETITSNETKINEEIQVIPTNTITNTVTENKFQEPITSLINEAEKLNNDASTLRKNANSKTGSEKDADLNAAKSLETQAVTKKVEAANKQQQLNTATYRANKQSLEELAVMAKGKNISELNSVDEQLKEADALLKQANSLRTETANYPSDAAKLGGYSNAEEKENLALQKQKAALDIYKKYFSNYTAKEPNLSANNNTNTSIAIFDSTNQQSIDSLNLLINNSNDLYKNRFLSINKSLNPVQTELKTKAQTAYKKNQALLLQANQTADVTKKKNILIDANNFTKNAVNLLTQINETTAIANNITTNKTTVNSTPIKEVEIQTEELVVSNTNAYTNAKPIPIDEKMPDGLVYKVQIGAFTSALPNNTFKGLSPVVGQTTPSGLIRYMVGNYGKIENATTVKNNLNKLGYTDAFVVAYYNGVRVNLNEVLNKAKSTGENIAETKNTPINTELTKNTSVASNNQTVTNTSTNNIVNTTTEAIAITSELEKMNGLLYTVQIGVYSKQTTRSQLLNLKPIYTEQLPNGFYRYTAGIYNQSDLIIGDRRKVVDLGVKDAFITAYYNAKRIPFTEGKKLQLENSNLKMETQKPIVFNENSNTTIINNAPINTPSVATTTSPLEIPANTSTVSVTAFSNGVTTTPIPTPENGVKIDDAGISFKVQVGAYRYQVPNDVASKFLSIKNWPVNNLVINGLYIYTFGNFNAASFAKKLRDEAVALGITDAFVTVYKDGKKLYGAEAIQYLNR